MSFPPVTDAPLVRALLRTLLFAACIEAIFFRLLTIPARSVARPWIGEIHASTGRAGMLMFFVAFALLLLTLMTIAYAALRLPVWPGGANAFVSMGILALVALGLTASVGTPGPAFAIGFSLLALAVGLVMLAGLFERRADLAGRAFAVCFGGALLCAANATLHEAAPILSMRWLPDRLEGPIETAGLWLLFSAGALAFPAFSPSSASFPSPSEKAAAWGVPFAAAAVLIVGAVVDPPFLSRIGATLGPGPTGLLPGIARTTAAASALFLVTFTALRSLPQPRQRARGFGLLFVLLAGYPPRVVYEHLLIVLGLALLTAPGAPRVESPAVVLHVDEHPSRDA